jgi:hypothetical protein
VSAPTGLPGRSRIRPLDGRPPGPAPDRLAQLLVQAWLEVRAGRRPLSQLDPLLAPAARRRLAAQLSLRPDAAAPVGRVHRVRSCAPSPDACEASVLVRRGARTTAFAVRLERHRGVWRAVELTAPEAGFAPLPTASLGRDAPLRDAFDEAAAEAGEHPP